ncbi:MAG: type I pullulanase [Oscillospiraceae bacterium]|nr:type I pullulanase [Oscillospiraceae bacterium]
MKKILGMKRILSLCLAALLLLVYLPVTSAADEKVITIHYQRSDGAYDEWNIWSWADAEGSGYQFTEKDAFGMIATVTIDTEMTRIGFLLRRSTSDNDWAEKEFGDRFVDLTLGSEIWVISGREEFLYEAPEGYADVVQFTNLEIIVHRDRYDGRLAEEEMRLSLNGEDIPVRKSGSEYRAVLNNVNSVQKPVITFIIDGKETAFEMSISKAEPGIAYRVYSGLGKGFLAGAEKDLGKEKMVKSAEVTGIDEINVRLSYPTTLVPEGFTAIGGDSDYSDLEPGYATSFILKTDEPIDLNTTYTVEFDGYTPLSATVGNKYFSSEGFEDMYTYDGELGAIYTKDKTTFKLWSPVVQAARVNLYPDGGKSELLEAIEMTSAGKGVWVAEVNRDLKNIYYTYTVTNNGEESEAIDPYARAAGVNGKRGMVVNLSDTNPEGWENDVSPPFENPTDAVIYELHVRDLSTAESSGIVNKGKYLAFTEEGTKSPGGLSTGIDHIVELGITHVHLLPVFDFRSIDESKLNENKFNWGYDPENYNLPEGSFSTDPYDGNVRINEFKQMVQSMHKNGLRVVMDVVYNHTGATANSNLNLLVPNYYYRFTSAGNFSDGSGCGNETASERSMMRKLIIDSVIYWATEYNIDGFRFDLMGIHDIETMNLVRAALDEIDPTILLYGEGWSGGTVQLPRDQQALKVNTPKLDERFAVFSDDMRDGIKGGVFDHQQPGFVSGDYSRREDVAFGIAASVFHPQIDYTRITNPDSENRPWAKAPSQTVNYVSAHDNLTLYDKFKASRPDLGETEWLEMNKMAALLVLTSQGIPFFQAGEEFARSKFGNSNSYESSDAINQLDWNRKTNYNDLYEYYRGLIALRKAQPSFRLQTADEIAESITFMDVEAQVIAYTLKADETLFVAVNADDSERTVTLPVSGWDILVDGQRAGTSAIGRVDGNTLTMPARTGYVLLQRDGAELAAPSDTSTEAESDSEDEQDSGRAWWPFALGGAILILAGAAVPMFVKRR